MSLPEPIREDPQVPPFYIGVPPSLSSETAGADLLAARLRESEERCRVLMETLDRRAAERAAEAVQKTEQLRALAAELVHTEQRKRKRLARVMHDHLQQLLVGAKFGIGSLRGRVRTKAQQQTLEQVAEVLDEAIKAARSLTAELSPPVLHEKGLAAGLEWLARQMREKHNLAVEVTADGDADLEAEQVRVLLFDAVRELLFNVVKHAGADRARVRLCRLDGDRVEVTVVDEGAGFDPAVLEAAAGAGGGFGLFSIRERLQYLGGRMDIQTAPGRGSRFTLVAPVRLAAPARETPVAVAEKPVSATDPASESVLFSAGERIRVLLADDHPVMRQGLARLLADYPDIEVVGEAGDGLDAVHRAGQLKPDVVLMDVTMPEMSGIEATRRIVGHLPQVRVIGLSMHEESDMAAAMRQAGATAYLTKGGPTDDLVAAIRATRRPAASS